MRRDTRLSGVLHVLVHMADAECPVTSETMAAAMNTNAAVVRRTMTGLRRAGIVQARKGPGGGWTLMHRPSDIALSDVYAALGSPASFAIGHRSEAPVCPVERTVNCALDDALRRAQAALLEGMSGVKLSTLVDDVRTRAAGPTPLTGARRPDAAP